MTRLKLIPWAAGVCLLVATLLGANRLLQTDAPAAGAGGDAAKKPTIDGLLVHGTVASDPEIVAYGLPQTLAAGIVAEVFVKEGDEIQPGTPLYRFDDKLAKADVAKAEAGVTAADKDIAVAKKKAAQQAIVIAQAEHGVKAATTQRDQAKRGVDAARELVDRENALTTPTEKLTQADIDRRKKLDPKLVQAEGLLAIAEDAITAAKFKKDLAEAEPVAELVAKAEAGKAAAEADRDRAKVALEECTMKARGPGIVERLAATPGTAAGPASRSPILYLVPKTGIIVRGTVVPDFAHKVGERVGQKVIVTDDANIHQTYAGVVERVGNSFLPNRTTGADPFAGKPSMVLEVVVRVTDPSPAGKPPLRIGQPVRVSFP